ncbi:MAG TPA: hypothetical protein VN922_23800, partial [Bacteroidia bacterium]|nr:hypothetical protein [Bacteroidia bacterium]
MKKIDVKAIIAAFFILCTISLSASNPWTKMSNFTGAARDYGTSFTIGHYGFIGCGFNGSTYYNDFYKWNQTTNTWSA